MRKPIGKEKEYFYPEAINFMIYEIIKPFE
jgi:hypothetical protein